MFHIYIAQLHLKKSGKNRFEKQDMRLLITGVLTMSKIPKIYK